MAIKSSPPRVDLAYQYKIIFLKSKGDDLDVEERFPEKPKIQEIENGGTLKPDFFIFNAPTVPLNKVIVENYEKNGPKESQSLAHENSPKWMK
ncbi:hypothetical protein AVEN_63585-1 [Araneus ventricosus]|uniref:Uncharacterized protein n=1 Tax=Araneus ventricosus TaxID=182803 RepID=A0A4Y2U4Q0_ARAVE|nr:hypothetical protein AVEN_63585-1 [Araneus ventricosus]